MSNRRTNLDFPRNEAGLVDEFIGTAYDVVESVSRNLPELQRLDGVLEDIPELADSTAKQAVENAMPPVRAELKAGVDTVTGLVDEAEQTVVEGKAEINTATTQGKAQVAATATAANVVIDTKVTAANTAAQKAQSAADAAQLSGGVYATTALGIAATAVGRYFSVPADNTNDYLVLYQNNAGVAVEVKRYPSSEPVQRSMKTFATKAAMLADLSAVDGNRAEVTSDTPANNGWYTKAGATGTGTWTRADQLATDSDVDKVVTQMSLRKRPRGRNTRRGNRLTTGVGDTKVLMGVQLKIPRAKNREAQGSVLMLGETLVPGILVISRPRSQNFGNSPTVFVSGRSVLLSTVGSNGSTVYIPETGKLAKQIQEQTQSIPAKRPVFVQDGKIKSVGTAGAVDLTSSTGWLSAQAGPFDVTRAIGDADNNGVVEAYSVLKDGQAIKEGLHLFFKMATGQSLTLGSRGLILNASGEYTIDGQKGNLFSDYVQSDFNDLLTLPGGPRPANWVGATDFAPVREYVSGVTAETPATSYMLNMQKWLQKNTGLQAKHVYAISAVGGVPYATLKKGTTTYSNMLSYLNVTKSICALKGWTFSVPSISIVHGESQRDTTQAQYVAMLAEWISDMRTDFVTITGQSVAPRGLVSQMLTGETGTIPAIPLAQLQSHNENPNIVLIGPKYAYPYFDQYHLQGQGYIKMGELEARVDRLQLVNATKWQPLLMQSAVVTGKTIKLTLNNVVNGKADTNGAIGPLALDSTIVVDPGNFGFQLSVGNIVSVTLGKEGNTILITTAADVVAGTVLTYALQPTLNSPQTGNGRRGCVRDTDCRDYSRFDNTPVYNWLCAFSSTLEVQ